MEESRPATWVLRNLWKANSICATKLPILDTIFRDERSLSGLYWLFTSSDGIIRKKSESNSHMDEVKNRFLTHHMALRSSDDQEALLKERKQDPIVASIIDRNSFSPMTRSVFIEVVNAQSIDSNQAVQSLRPALGNATSRLIVEMKVGEGQNVYKYHKMYVSERREVRANLTAASICEHLRKYCEEIAATIERNTKQRIVLGIFMFLEDYNRMVWFMGTVKCVTKDELSPKTQKCYSSVYSSRSYRSASASRFISPLRKACAGDFCSFLMKTDFKESKNDLDTDGLLQKVRSAYGAEGDREANKIKLTLAVDYLMREKERLRPKNVSNLIPFKYIMIGKELLKGRDDIHVSNEVILEIDLKGLIESSKSRSNFDISLHKDPHLHPSRLYDSVKVCDRCYDIYTTLKTHLEEEVSISKLKTPPIIRPIKSFEEVPKLSMRRDSSTPKLSGASKRHHFYTPLGKINKNSISDLLVDMNHALVDLELQRHSNYDNVQERLKSYYETRTEEYKQSLIKQQIQEEPELMRSITPQKLESANIEEEIAMKVFSTESTKKWNLKHKDESAQESWRKYLKWLRVKKIQPYGSLTSR
jgi:hypothetical protein